MYTKDTEEMKGIPRSGIRETQRNTDSFVLLYA